MALDSVELVMEFEDFFELTIPNEDAQQLVTVAGVTDYLTRRLAAEGRPLERASVLAMVCVITCDECGTMLDKVTESTLIADLGID